MRAHLVKREVMRPRRITHAPARLKAPRPWRGMHRKQARSRPAQHRESRLSTSPREITGEHRG